MKISSLAQPDRTVNKCGQTALCTQTSGLRNKQIMENGFLIDVDKSMPVQCRKRRPNQKLPLKPQCGENQKRRGFIESSGQI